jgi:FlaA1/EpsC-like NDP-sugar epimerase
LTERQSPSPDRQAVDIDVHNAKQTSLPEPEGLEALVRRKNGGDEHLRSENKLAGKRCLITGASKGIGKAIAERFAEEGARCLLVGRNQELLADVAQKIKPYKVLGHEKGFDKSHRVIVGDVGKEEVWEEFKKDVC